MTIKFIDYKLLSKNDSIHLLSIRNSDFIRKNSNNADVIKTDEHLKWVESLDNAHNIYYAIEVDGLIVGGINLTQINTKEQSAYWGLFFKDDNLPLISSLVTYLFLDMVFNKLNFKKLDSEVMVSNTTAYKFSLNFGLNVCYKFKRNNIDYYKMHITQMEWNNKKTSGYRKLITRRIQSLEYYFIDYKGNK
jgi:RimJ/RimL family protein N-acetyltransferase